MDNLTEAFNRQAHWHIFILPLWVLLILDDLDRRERKRRNRILNLQRAFNDAAMTQSRDRYYRQANSKCALRP
tara:strand:- start:3783 stop:4001 length:219 start_codon:yes stop_codon:yes gene_type:complete